MGHEPLPVWVGPLAVAKDFSSWERDDEWV
jgi:hypothetical protein